MDTYVECLCGSEVCLPWDSKDEEDICCNQCGECNTVEGWLINHELVDRNLEDDCNG